MRIKTFYAKTMAEAMEEIKEALGPDALLLSTKGIPNRSGIGGAASGYEVVAAIDEEASEEAVRRLSSQRHAKAEHPIDSRLRRNSEPDYGDQNRDLVYIPHFLRRPGSNFKHGAVSQADVSPGKARTDDPAASKAPEPPFEDPPSSSLYWDLLASGVDEWLARKLLSEARELVEPNRLLSRENLLQAAGQVAQALAVAVTSPDGVPTQRVVALFGPSGVGKTTSIAKLAARLALQRKKKVVLMTLDSFRIGAVEQLRTYAGLMGIPFRFVSRAADLPKAIREQGQRDYILIDTAGCAPRDAASIRHLADYLQTIDQAERHLVLSATTKPADIREAVDCFELCKTDHLLFTKLDETTTLGPILNELIRTRKSMSYYSDGQRVPEDLHAAPAGQLVDIVLHRN